MPNPSFTPCAIHTHHASLAGSRRDSCARHCFHHCPLRALLIIAFLSKSPPPQTWSPHHRHWWNHLSRAALESKPSNFDLASCHRVKTTASIVVWVGVRVRVSGGSGGLKNIRITQRRRNGLSWFGPIRSLHPASDDPYTQEHPKSRGLQPSVEEEKFGRGLARC